VIRSVLIARGAYGYVYEPAWARALSELGVRVHLFDSHAHTLPSVLGRVERRLLWGLGIKHVNRRLLEIAHQERPDVTLLYQGHYFPASSIQRLRKTCFVSGYHNDDPFGDRRNLLRYRHLLPALPHYHGFHVYRRHNADQARDLGVKEVGVLMPGFIPWLDYPRRLNSEERRKWHCDVVFVGHMEKDQRIECIIQAVQNNVNFKVYGSERFWRPALPNDVYSRVGPARVLNVDEYRLALCGAKIGACFVSKWNRDGYTRRTFEIPACGVFMLAERTLEIAELFKEGVEADFFSSPAEFLDKARFYLQNDTLRQKIAIAGYHKVINAKHDIYSRMRQWLADITTWRGENGRCHTKEE